MATLILAGCSGAGSDLPTAQEEFGNLIDPSDLPPPADDDEPPVALAVEETNSEPVTSTVAPSTTVASAEEVLASSTRDGDDPRVTTANIRVGIITDDIDLGNGPEERKLISASSPAGRVASIFDEDAIADTATIDSQNWAANNRVLVIRVEVGAQVSEVRLLDDDGILDRVTPDADRFALLAGHASGPSTVTVEALGDDGTVIGICDFNDFFTCTN